MTLIERATKSANSLAEETVSTVSQIGTAVAEGVVVTAKDIRAGLKEGQIRPATVIAAAAIGLVAVVEWPVLVAAGGLAVIATKLRKRPTETPQSTETLESDRAASDE